WDLTTHPEALTLRGHPAEVRDVVFSPDDQTLASVDASGLIKIWDSSTGQEILTASGYSAGPYSLACSPRGKTLPASGEEATVGLLEASTGRRLLTCRGHRGIPMSVTFSPDGRWIASVSHGPRLGEVGEIKVWDATSGEELLSLPGHPTETEKIGSIVFSPDGQRLVRACNDHAVQIYDIATRRRLFRLQGHSAPVLGVAIRPDGRIIASASDDNTVKLWDMATGSEIRTLVGHSREVISVAFSPDGARLVSGSNDRTLKVWDVESGQEILTLRGHGGVVRGVRFSHDGQRIASTSEDGTVKIWGAMPLSPGRREQRRAAALANRFVSESLPREDIIDRIRTDPTIDGAIRRAALAMVERHRPDPERFSSLAMDVIARPGCTEAEYRLALRRAE